MIGLVRFDAMAFVVKERNNDATWNGGIEVKGRAIELVATSDAMLGLLEVEEEDETSAMIKE